MNLGIEKVNGIYYFKSAILSWAIWWISLIVGLTVFVLRREENIASIVMIPLIVGIMILSVYLMLKDYKANDVK